MTEEVSKERLRSDIRDAIDANMIGGSDEHPTISTDGLVGDLVELFTTGGFADLLRLRPPTEARGEPFEEARQDAWSLFEAEYLTDGEGHAPASTYSACREAFNSAWNGGNSMEATRAAIAAFQSAHPPAREAVDDDMERAARVGWNSGRNSWCPSGVLADTARTEQDWLRARPAILAALQVKP